MFEPIEFPMSDSSIPLPNPQTAPAALKLPAEVSASPMPAIDAATGDRRALTKFLLLALTITLAVAAWRFTPLRQYVDNIQTFKNRLDQSGLWAPVIFTGISAAFISFGISRLLFCGIAGASFGFLEGVLYSEIATIVGSYLTFLYSRWLGGDLIKNRFKNWKKMDRLIQNHSLMGIILLRQLPIGGIFSNLVLGMTSIRHGTFLLGSAIGFLPEGMVVTLLGSSPFKGNLRQSAWQITLAIALGIVCWFAIWKIHQRSCLNRQLEETFSKPTGEDSSPEDDSASAR